jgi:hypothetical protein
MKKAYHVPTVTSEQIKVGVFGCYGSDASGPIGILFPVFGICCH